MTSYAAHQKPGKWVTLVPLYGDRAWSRAPAGLTPIIVITAEMMQIAEKEQKADMEGEEKG